MADPLIQAILSSDTKTIETRIKNGAKLNKRSSAGFSPLHIAAVASSVDVLELLLASGADPNFPDGTFGRTAVHWAVCSLRIDSLAVLLHYNGRLDVVDKDKQTPMDILKKWELRHPSGAKYSAELWRYEC
jgi:ankyrin repeat protein